MFQTNATLKSAKLSQWLQRQPNLVHKSASEKNILLCIVNKDMEL